MSNILTNNINPRSGNKITIGGVNDTVSIAGTVTYEDVTSVDSVGVVTARGGLDVGVGGTVITTTAGGSVGIGLTNPEKLLEVSGRSSPTIRINNSDSSISADQTIGAIEFKANDGSNDGSQVTGSIESISQAAFTGQGSPSHIIFKTNGASGANALTERLRITYDGKIGIGTDNPDERLEVGDGTVSGALKVSGQSNSITSDGFTVDWESSSNSTRFFSEPSSGGSSEIRFFTTNSGTRGEKLRIDSSGRLLIGTVSSTTNGIGVFSGFAGTPGGTGVIDIKHGGTPASSGNDVGQINFYDTRGQFAQILCEADGTTGVNDYPARLVFSTTADGASSPTERMRIDSAGTINLGGGSTSENNNVIFWPNVDSGGFVEVRKTSSAGNGDRFMSFKRNGTQIGTITLNGTSNTAYNTSGSDSRLKKNFETWDEEVLSHFKSLQPKKFNFISEDDGTEKTKGFIAQDNINNFPEAYPLTVNPETNESRYMYNPSGMVIYLMKALQEEIAKREELEERIAALEGN